MNSLGGEASATRDSFPLAARVQDGGEGVRESLQPPKGYCCWLIFTLLGVTMSQKSSVTHIANCVTGHLAHLLLSLCYVLVMYEA